MSVQTVTAHSGAFDTPDNSLDFIRAVLEKGCEILEMDVAFRPDGSPVMIHKGSPARDEGVPLEEAFALIATSDTLRMNLDLKSVKNLPRLVALLEAYGLKDRAFYTGVGKGWVKAVKAEGELPYYLNAGLPPFLRKNKAAIRCLADRVKAVGAVGLNTHYDNVNADTVRIFHKKGLEVSVWTVNDEDAARRMLAAAPDNVTSRHPDMIIKIKEER